MRRSLLLLTAVPLLVAPHAFAGEKNAERPSVCRVPDVDLSYDTATFSALVSLPASGCRSRAHTQFILSASISRLDHEGGRDVAERSAICGPFRRRLRGRPGPPAVLLQPESVARPPRGRDGPVRRRRDLSWCGRPAHRPAIHVLHLRRGDRRLRELTRAGISWLDDFGWHGRV